MVENFPNSKTVSKGRKKDIVILGEAPLIKDGEKVVLLGMM